jgi:hypothetical protein
MIIENNTSTLYSFETDGYSYIHNFGSVYMNDVIGFNSNGFVKYNANTKLLTSELLTTSDFDPSNISSNSTPNSIVLRDPNGKINASGFNTTSDHRIKTDIRDLETETIDNVRPVKYNNTQTNNECYGLIAHELAEIYPNMVNGSLNGDNYQTVHENPIISGNLDCRIL